MRARMFVMAERGWGDQASLVKILASLCKRRWFLNIVMHRSFVVVFGLVGLNACGTDGPQQLRAYGPSWKSSDQFLQEHEYCKSISIGAAKNLPIIANCMLASGNAVKYDNDPIIFPPNFFSSSPPPPPPQFSPPPILSSGIATLFQTIVIANQEIILLAAHPSGTIDDENVTIEQSDENGAIIVDTIAWHTKRSFQTTLRFKLTYDNEGAVDSVKIDVEDTNGPFLAFLAADMAKQLIMNYVSDKTKKPVFKAVLKTINSDTNIKQGLEDFLLYLVNHPNES